LVLLHALQGGDRLFSRRENELALSPYFAMGHNPRGVQIFND
jgi:hypothetical protein